MTVRFFASLREAVGLGREEFDIYEGSRVDDFLKMLRETYPILGDKKKYIVAVNSVRSKADQRLREGDIVALLPPVGGG